MEVMDDDARLIPEEGLPEAPFTIPLSWDFPQDAAERLEAACVAAEECAEACAAALQETDGEAHRTLAAISGVAGFAAECGRGASSDSRMALSLCVRVIESNSTLLDGLGRTTGGTLAASSARRVAAECSRALVASYLDVEDWEIPGFDPAVRSELLLRAVNERIVEIGANDAAALEILCECGDASCISTVAISVRDYERVRRDSSRFVVSEGHELADIERVNERTPEYLVVEKAL